MNEPRLWYPRSAISWQSGRSSIDQLWLANPDPHPSRPVPCTRIQLGSASRGLWRLFFFCWSFLSSHSRFYWFRHSILANVGPAVCVRTVLEKSTPSLTSRVFSETPTASSTGRHKKPMGKKQRWKAVRVVRSIHRLASRRVTRFTLGVVCCRRRRLFCV